MKYNFDLSNLDKVILRHFFPLLYDKNIYLLLMGGAGSGKSVFAIMKILIRIMLGYKSNTIHNQLVIMKTANSMKNTVIAEFQKWIKFFGINQICEFKLTPKEIIFDNGSRIFFLGCDDPDKLLSLSGVTSIWIEEASRITLNDFEIIDTRLRGVVNTYPQIMLSFNPISKLSWIYNYFYVEVKDGATLHHSMLRDNYLLQDEGYKQRIRNYEHTNINKYRTFWLGEWGSLEGSIYDNYEVVNEFPDDSEFDDIIYGLDYGFNNPNALLKVGIKDQEYYWEELIYETGQTLDVLIQNMKQVIPKRYREKYYIYADSQNPDKIMEINNQGFICYKSDKSINDGIDFVKSQKIKIHKDSYNLQKEIEGYVYKTDKDGNSLEIPLKMNDHLMDSARYSMYTYNKTLNLEPGVLLW